MVNTICLETAVDWTTQWRAQKGTFVHHEDLKGFLIPLADLQEVMEEEGVVNVRAYLGVNKDNDFQPHLIIVGVDEAGKDIIYKAAGEGCKEADVDNGLNTGLYDFSQPCPTTCDITSPLYGPQK